MSLLQKIEIGLEELKNVAFQQKISYYFLGYIVKKRGPIEALILIKIIALDRQQSNTNMPRNLIYFFYFLILRNHDNFDYLLIIYTNNYSEEEVLDQLSEVETEWYNWVTSRDSDENCNRNNFHEIFPNFKELKIEDTRYMECADYDSEDEMVQEEETSNNEYAGYDSEDELVQEEDDDEIVQEEDEKVQEEDEKMPICCLDRNSELNTSPETSIRVREASKNNEVSDFIVANFSVLEEEKDSEEQAEN